MRHSWCFVVVAGGGECAGGFFFKEVGGCTYRNANSNVNQITTKISILSNISVAWASYSSIVEKTLKAKHVNTIKNL